MARAFESALAARDKAAISRFLEQVLITPPYAAYLTARFLAEHDSGPIRLSLDDQRNAGFVRWAACRNDLAFPSCMLRLESPRDPFLSLGSHPDVVERVWNVFGRILPQDCRCVVYGNPALVAPESGVVLAHALGTVYVLRVPMHSLSDAIGLGGKTTGLIDLGKEHGEGWIFGFWSKMEEEWSVDVFNEVEL